MCKGCISDKRISEMTGSVECDFCGKELYPETERYEQDECFEFDGYIFCENCIMPYMRKNYRKELKACVERVL